MVYRTDKLQSVGLQLKDWSDLWNPKLAQRISLLNQPREVIGLTLKSMGKSYNEVEPDTIADLESQLKLLHKQTRFYDSQNYMQPLLLGDTWVAMGWSTDVLPALAKDSRLGVVFPSSGSALWADLWVQPVNLLADKASKTDANNSAEIVDAWLNYWWEPEVANDLSLFTSALSVFHPESKSQDQEPANPILGKSKQLLATETEDPSSALALRLQRSEPILPLSKRALSQYQQLWLTTRMSES